MATTQLILATTSDDWETRVRQAFDGQLNGGLRRREDVLASDDAMQAARSLTDVDAHVVVIGPTSELDHALDLARNIDDERPDVCVVLAADPTPQLFQHALRAGVRDIVAPDATLTEIRETLERALETATRRRVTASEDRTRQTAKVIAVVAPKGGAGKTAISTNLAVGLAQRAPGQVALVDLDLQFGDVANALRLQPSGTIADISRSMSALDSTTVKAYLTPHGSDLYVLCAPDSPAGADDVPTECIGKLVDLLSGVFPYVVIDTAAGLDEFTLAAMEHATDLVVVCGTDVASARAMRKEIEAFDLLGLTTQQRHFVLNRSDARVGLSVGDIEGTVGMSVDVSIPSSRAVPMSMNQGVSMLETDDRSPVGRALLDLVARLQPPAASSPQIDKHGALWRRRKETTR